MGKSLYLFRTLWEKDDLISKLLKRDPWNPGVFHKRGEVHPRKTFKKLGAKYWVLRSFWSSLLSSVANEPTVKTVRPTLNLHLNSVICFGVGMEEKIKRCNQRNHGPTYSKYISILFTKLTN